MGSSGKFRDFMLWSLTALAVLAAALIICVLRISLDPAIVLGLAAAASVLAIGAIASPYVRLLVFVGGALLVMQSDTSALAAMKPVYLAFVVLAGLIGASNVSRLPLTIRKAYRPIFLAGTIMLGLVVLEALGSILAGVDPLRVVRDATTYLMIAAAPFIAADATRQGGVRRARLTAGAMTLIAALGFAVFWLSARGVGTLGLDRLVMFSFILSGFGFSLGLAYGFVRRNILWMGLGVIALVSVLVTGTRTGLLMLVALVALIGSNGARRVPPMKMVLGLGVIGLALAYLLPAAASTFASADFLSQRATALLSVLSEGISSDQSGIIRLRAINVTLNAWSTNPLFGVGFGFQFPSLGTGLPPSDFQVDSPALLLAKFGVIGTLAVAAAFLLIARGIWRFHVETCVRTEAQAAGLGLILICVAFAFLASPVDDKGFALAFSLVFYLLGVEHKRSTSEPSSDLDNLQSIA